MAGNEIIAEVFLILDLQNQLSVPPGQNDQITGGSGISYLASKAVHTLGKAMS